MTTVFRKTNEQILEKIRGTFDHKTVGYYVQSFMTTPWQLIG